MKTSSTIHSFLLSEQEGNILLTAQERPWSVLQVIPTTPADFDRTVAALKERGMVAHHDTDRTFCIIHLASGDHDGKHPETAHCHHSEQLQADHRGAEGHDGSGGGVVSNEYYKNP